MKSISPGDVYLTSPALKTESGKETKMTKDLTCWMGTVSQRPVVIIREPKAWDRFNTVTVIAGFSKDGPSIPTSVEGIYGTELRKYKYEWYPHMVYTIPVNRLSRFLGRLTNREFNDLTYASNWINNVNMQENPEKYPVPSVYETAEMYVEEYENTKYDSPNGIVVSNNLKMTGSDLPEEYQGYYFELDSDAIPRRFRPEYNTYHGRINADKARQASKNEDEEEEEEQPKDDSKVKVTVRRMERIEPVRFSSDTASTKRRAVYDVTEDMVPIHKEEVKFDTLKDYLKHTSFNPLNVMDSIESQKIEVPTNLDRLPNVPSVDSMIILLKKKSIDPELKQQIINRHKKLTPFDYYILTHGKTHTISKICGVKMSDASIIRQCYTDIDTQQKPM